MLKHDSPEYWQGVTWDRYRELDVVPAAVRHEFLEQERLTVCFVSDLCRASGELRIMDLACGTGKMAGRILETMPGRTHVTLVDFNQKTLQRAAQSLSKYKDVDYVLLDAYGVGERFANHFDVVVSLDFFHHVSRLDFLLWQIRQAMRPEGVLVANVLAKETYSEWEDLKYGFLKALRRRAMHGFGDFLYPWSPTILRKLVRQTGVARLEPLSERELVTVLSPCFYELGIKRSYYYWFTAMARPSIV